MRKRRIDGLLGSFSAVSGLNMCLKTREKNETWVQTQMNEGCGEHPKRTLEKGLKRGILTNLKKVGAVFIRRNTYSVTLLEQT